MTAKNLNARQELFVQGLLVGKSADRAYRESGYKSHRANAARMSANDNIVRRLEELRAPVVKAAQMTLETHLRDLLGLRNMATNAGQFAAAVTAETNRGKAAGLYIERRIIGIKRLDDMTHAELEYLLGELDLADIPPAEGRGVVLPRRRGHLRTEHGTGR